MKHESLDVVINLKMSSSNSINNHLAVMRSAFSTVTASAKVPDGRVSASIAQREAACNVVIQGASDKALIFALYPGLSGGLSVFKISNGTSTTTGTGASTSIEGVVSQLAQIKFDSNLANNAANAPLMPEKFRCVSAALRLSCVNSAQFNNGWFEAIRVPTDYKSIAEGTTQTTAVAPSTTKPDNQTSDMAIDTSLAEGVAAPDVKFENNLFTSTAWCNHPSYVTGKLVDLYKHQFYLQSTAEREFVRVAHRPDLLDINMDLVLIRVYSTAAQSSGVTLTNAIHYHCVHHFETVYDAGSEKCRYHSQCLAAPKLVEKVDKSIKKDPKASIIRSPNAYGVNPY